MIRYTVTPLLAIAILLSAGPLAMAQDAILPDLPKLDLPTGIAPFQGPTTAPAAVAPELSTTLVRLAARLTADGRELGSGMTWRIFSPTANSNGKLPLIATSDGGIGEFRLAPGSYLVHAAFGRAGATKRISVGRETKREDVVLDAGGLKLNALLAGGKDIPAGKLRFSVFEDKANAAGNRALIVPDVKPNTIVRLNAGVYHIVSTYGSVNSVIRSDIRVEAGKLTEATVEHQAAQVTLKLVREAGGEALAETSWSIVNDSGDSVHETVGPFATFVLSEGNYTVIANNRDRIFQQELNIESGKDQEIDVIANAQSEIDPNEGAD